MPIGHHVREHVAGYKAPRDILVVDEIVRSPSGKPDYRWGKATAIAGWLDADPRPPVGRRDEPPRRDEISPYLRQHADNPVDWYPWGDEAFARARAEDKPILLSVGYSACHWCHVMAHESFEDDEVAAVMNDRFVNVKVDREERPDVDAIYMDAVQALTGRGGWPMTVFLTPDGRPFFGGTYFPKDDRQGMPGFLRVMDAIDDVWSNQRDDVFDQAEQLTTRDGEPARSRPARGRTGRRALPRGARPGRGRARRTLRRDAGRLRRRAEVPARRWRSTSCCAGTSATADPETLTMVTTTLDAMAAGGIYDHVGGGFARYSTDAHWLVPHFEKMLYDQALLVGAYLRGVPRHRRAAVPADRRGDDHVRPARPAPPRRRLLLRRGCGQRGRRGQVLPLEPRRAHRGVRRRRAAR